jgi:dipeptidyl aminopeptidase/acylaminoacyl peptidase
MRSSPGPLSVLVGLAACGGASTRPAPPPAPGPVAEAPPPAETPAAAPASYTGLGMESVAPELIARHAPAPLDPDVTSRIQAILDLRGSGSGLVTSRGDRIVFTWNVTGTAQVWRQDGPMRFPVQLTGGEDATAVAALSPDDRWAVVSRDRRGEENPGLYLLELEGGPLIEIQHKPKVQTRLAFISDDARHVYFTSNDLDPASYALHRWERASGKRETLFTEPGIWVAADHAGDRVLLLKLLGNTQREVWELELGSRRLTPLLGQGENEQYEVAYGARPGTLIVRTNKLSDLNRLYEWRAGELAPITPELPHEIADFGIDEARSKIVYEVNEGGYLRAHALDARTFRPLPLPPLREAEHVFVSGLSRDGRFLNLTVNSSTLPSTTVTYDWRTRKTITWRPPSTPEIDVGTFARATLEHYPARDGTPIPMFVRRPARCDEPCPVLVDFHGGPEAQSLAGWNPVGQMFVDAGFVYVEPNVRGSSGYGKTWMDADNGPRRLEVITDIEDCALHIRKEWARDGRAPKIGVMGGSYGGYATLMAMTYFAGAYDAGASNVGISNLLTFLQNTAPYRRILRTSEYGDPDRDRDVLLQLSPVTYIDRIKGPLLIEQGVNDPRVPVGEALLIHDALVSRGIESQLMLFADEGHGASRRSNRVLSIGHTIAFFQKHLR